MKPERTVRAQIKYSVDVIKIIASGGTDKKVHVYATVDEADIGLIRSAEERKQPVKFTVDAYPDLFEGHIYQVRKNSTTTQNVVTYTVVISVDNAGGRLLPYLTTRLQFEVEARTGVLLVPNAALRWQPRVPGQ